MFKMSPTQSPDFATARFNMVDSQLRPNKVTDPAILEAMGTIPRELFVPSTLSGVAYFDENVPLISSRFLLQPMILARMIQALEIKRNDRVLELAPASGYSTLVLAHLSSSVVAVEPDALLHKEAEKNTSQFPTSKIKILAGAPSEGCASHAPFDAIFVNGSVDYLPEILFAQLTEGGRVIAVIRCYGEAHAAHTGQARLYRKTGGKISWVSLFDANVPLVPGFALVRGFEF